MQCAASSHASARNTQGVPCAATLYNKLVVASGSWTVKQPSTRFSVSSFLADGTSLVESSGVLSLQVTFELGFLSSLLPLTLPTSSWRRWRATSDCRKDTGSSHWPSPLSASGSSSVEARDPCHKTMPGASKHITRIRSKRIAKQRRSDM